MTKQLLVESIRIDGQTQSRERINAETVAEYAEAMKAPTAPPWPPVTVFFDGTEYWLADGFHRLLAARKIGRKNITADVKQGTREDAAWAACAANQTHGLRRTNADKRKAVEIALKLHPEMSAHTIAEHCGVDVSMVADVRVRCGIPTPDRVTGKDGKSYPVPPPPAKRAAAQGLGPGSGAELTAVHGPPPRPEERGGPAAPPVGSPPPPPPTKAKQPSEPAHSTGSGQVDDVGRRIPDALLPLWNRRQEVQDMLTTLSRIRCALRAAQESRDPLYSEIPFSSALVALDQAYDAVQVAKPYAVCAMCQGHGCKACGERGILGKFRWDMCVPREHKEAVARIIEKEERR